MHSTVLRKLRWVENNRWARKAAQIQSYANINDTKSCYEAQTGVYGPSRFSLYPVRCTYDILITNKELILARWAEYLQSLLNKDHTTDPDFLDDLPTLPIIQRLHDPPSFDEVEKAFSVSRITKQTVMTSSLLRSLSMVDVLCTECCIILS